MARPGHVYVMNTKDGNVKVGFSKNPEKRSYVLGRLKIEHVGEWHDQAESVERAAHKLLILAGHHLKNEIFTASVDEAVNAVNAAYKIAEDGNLNESKPRNNRIKKMVGFALEPELIEWLDNWVAEQTFPPSKTAVLEGLLRKFRDEQDKKVGE